MKTISSFRPNSPVHNTVVLLCAASQSKAEMQAAVWRMPADFDSSINDDNAVNAPTLEMLTKLENEEDYDDVKWYIL